MSARSTSLAVIVTLLAGIAYLEFFPAGKRSLPVVPIVLNCGGLKPGMRRIGDYGLQFDVPESSLTEVALFDTPIRERQYGIKPRTGTSELAISWYSDTGDRQPPEIPDLTFSGYVEKRRIVDDKGNAIGEDAIGYWNKGERWRRIRFWGGIAARYGSRNQGEVPSYGSVDEKDAVFFDEIVNSVCRVPVTAP